MDHARLLEQREAAHRLALISSVLMVTYGSVGASISGVQSLKDKMKSEICTLLEGVPERLVVYSVIYISQNLIVLYMDIFTFVCLEIW